MIKINENCVYLSTAIKTYISANGLQLFSFYNYERVTSRTTQYFQIPQLRHNFAFFSATIFGGQVVIYVKRSLWWVAIPFLLGAKQ